MSKIVKIKKMPNLLNYFMGRINFQFSFILQSQRQPPLGRHLVDPAARGAVDPSVRAKLARNRVHDPGPLRPGEAIGARVDEDAILVRPGSRLLLRRDLLLRRHLPRHRPLRRGPLRPLLRRCLLA